MKSDMKKYIPVRFYLFYFSLSISEVIADLAFGPKNSGVHFFLAVFFHVTLNGLSESVTTRSLQHQYVTKVKVPYKQR